MRTQYRCEAENRRRLVGASDRIVPGTGLQLNGIDYVEIATEDLHNLDVTFLKSDGVTNGGALVLTEDNIRITGGSRIIDPVITGVDISPEDTEGRILRVTVEAPGDYSTYRLSVIDQAADAPPDNIDSLLSVVPFSFLIDCEKGFDCRDVQLCPPPERTAPRLDHLAKDFESFRQLMLDRMLLTLPGWSERSLADLGVTLVEVLADAADRLSHAQDAASTETYLQTSRRRASVQRHTRLTGYQLHDGANARTAVVFEVDNPVAAQDDNGASIPVLPRGTQLLSRGNSRTVLEGEAIARAMADAPVLFETMTDVTNLRPERIGIPLYSWGNDRCCLMRGATQAFLRGEAGALDLHVGDLLVIEERHAPDDPASAPSDPTRRHLVRLSADPIAHVDHLDGADVTEIRWHREDALPFPVWIEDITDDEGATVPTAIAHGNVVLADHGQTLDFRSVPADAPARESRGLVPWVADGTTRFRPVLDTTAPISHSGPFDTTRMRAAPASSALRNAPCRAVPAVELFAGSERWVARRDLLGSDRFSADFVLEPEPREPPVVRFGDNQFGRQPGNQEFRARFRVGNGLAGNLGAEALGRMILPSAQLRDMLSEDVAAGGIELTDPSVARSQIEAALRDNVTAIRNPIPATDGTDPEPILSAKLNAPQAFRSQNRAVTEADYVAAAETHPEVARAVATRRWYGSWDVMVLTVERRGGLPVDMTFEQELRAFLDRVRLAGHDIEIAPPRPVPLDIDLVVCVSPDHVSAAVEHALLDTFSSGIRPDGSLGHFHPDRLSFGDPVYLSHIVAEAMAVPGVQWIGVENPDGGENGHFRRWHVPEVDHAKDGVITMERLEVARLSNDPNQPEDGRLKFIMLGGL